MYIDGKNIYLLFIKKLKNGYDIVINDENLSNDTSTIHSKHLLL